jgi:hypothetical protein
MHDDLSEAKTVMAVRSATGLGVMKAREFVRNAAPELVRRVLEGHTMLYECWLRSLPTDQTDRIQLAARRPMVLFHLTDPIGDDPEAGPIVRQVLDEIHRELEAEGGWRIGFCHLMWRTAKERLLREHGIVWYTPAEMNPGSIFD